MGKDCANKQAVYMRLVRLTQLKKGKTNDQGNARISRTEERSMAN
jgi:hypothetical protein